MGFSFFATIASLLAGVIYFFPGEIIYRGLRGNIPGPAAVAVYFLGLALCVFVVIFILSKILGNYRHIHYTFGKSMAVILLLTCIGVPLVSAGLEFLYELGIPEYTQPKNFVFLIDNSGSMTSNDPQNQRFDVVDSVANSLPADTSIGVYTFAGETTEVFKPGSVSPGSVHVPEHAMDSSGETALYECINKVADALPENMTKEATKFVILTDGNPTDSGYRDAVKNCNSKNIAVSCVGFGNYSKSTFVDLANRTGGNFMAADDVSQLSSSLSEIVNLNPINRDLISSRNDFTANSKLYAFLRVLFIIMIGFVFAYLKYLNASLSKFSLPFFIACCISSLLGGIFIEIFYQLYWFESFGRLALCLTFAFTPLLSNQYYSRISGSQSKNDYNNTANVYGGIPYPSGRL